MTPRALTLTAPGGPLGWPAGDVSLEDALAVLGRTGRPLVLGVDQAASSGFALLDPASGKVLESGVVKGTKRIAETLDRLALTSGFSAASLFVVLEDHAAIELDMRKRARFDPREGAPDRSPRVLCGLGAARGRWEALLDLRGHPASLRTLVAPRAWRRVVGKTARGTDPKAAAVAFASARLGRPVSDDEADAIAIAVWGCVEGLHDLAADRLRARAAARALRAMSGSPENDNGQDGPVSGEGEAC